MCSFFFFGQGSNAPFSLSLPAPHPLTNPANPHPHPSQDAKRNLGTVEAQMRDTVAATLDGGARGACAGADADAAPTNLPAGRVAPGPDAVDYSTERGEVDDPGAVNAAWR